VMSPALTPDNPFPPFILPLPFSFLMKFGLSLACHQSVV